VSRSPAGRQVRGAVFYLKASEATVARISPGQFVNQVKLEAIQRVHWPTRRETVTTAIMVIIMTSALALFFFGVDAVFSSLVKFLLGLLAK